MGMQGMQSMQMPMQMGQPNNMMHTGSGPLMMPVQTGGMGGQQHHCALNHHSGPGQHPFGKGSGKYNRVGNVGHDNDSSWRSRPMDGGGKNDAAMFVSRSEVTSSMEDVTSDLDKNIAASFLPPPSIKRRSESAEVSSGSVPVAAGHVFAQTTKVAEPADEEHSEQEEAEDDEHEQGEHDEREEAEGGLQEEAEEDEPEEAEADEQEEAEDDDQEEAEDGVQEEATRNKQDAEDEEEAAQKEKAGVCKGKAVVLGLKGSAVDKLGKLSL